ncbi:hypothetical protein ABVK25_008675 [Lepraria finkii]|uniref:Uncharacterized protein n=1 Tax=Lepraria finkii TaxID=1340010 RepID=A0ABR4B253_9LECA
MVNLKITNFLFLVLFQVSTAALLPPCSTSSSLSTDLNLNITLPSHLSGCTPSKLTRPAPHPWLYPLPSPPARVVAFSNYTTIQLNAGNLEDIITEFYWETQGVDPSTKLGVEKKSLENGYRGYGVLSDGGDDV